MPAAHPPWRWRWGPPALVGAVTFAVFLPTLENGFVDFDDDTVLLTNERFRGLTPSHLRWMLTSVTLGHWQPLTWLSFALDHHLWGLDPAGYHLTSLLLHVASAMLLTGLLVALVRRAVAPPVAERTLRVCAALAALAWSIHPLRVESVAWATERRDVLSGLFWLLTIAAYLGATGAPDTTALRRRGLFLAAVACCALSLLAKAWGMTLFAVLLVLDGYPLRRWQPGRRIHLLLEKLPFAALGVAAAVVAGYAQRDYMPGTEAHALGERGAQASYGLCFYLGKSLVPRALVPLYEFRDALDPTVAPYAWCVAAVVGITASLWALRGRWPAGLAAWAAYALILSPVLGITQAGPQIAADRYSYLAMLPWSAVAAGGGYRLATAALPPLVTRLAATAALCILVALGMLTVRQLPAWRDTASLWAHAVAVAPDNAFARANLAGALLRLGRPAEATAQVDALATLVATDPNHRTAALQLGVATGSLALLALEEGRIADARALLERAIALNPQDGRLRLTLAAAALDQGDVAQGMAQFRAALTRSRVGPEVRGAIARKLLERDRGREAEEILRPAVEMAPDDAALRINLGVALWQQGRRPDAIAEWRETLRRHPGQPDARDLLDRVEATGAE